MELQELAWKYFNAAIEKGVEECQNSWFALSYKAGCFLTLLLCGKVDTDYKTLSNEFYNDSEKGLFYNPDTFFVERLQEFPEDWLRYAGRAHYGGEPIASIIEKLARW